jgi:hypothetical protein
MNHSIRYFLSRVVLGLIIVFALLGPGVGLAVAKPIYPVMPSEPELQQRWSTYNDDRFDFAIDYPADWYVLPRDDSPGRIGSVVSFSNSPELASMDASYPEDRVVVSVGFYFVKIESNQSLAQWSQRYDEISAVFAPNEINLLEQRTVAFGDRQGILRRGVSPLGEYQVANARAGEVVWFVWGNADPRHVGFYNHMVASFELGPTSPRTLDNVYAPGFRAFTLESLASLPTITRTGKLAQPAYESFGVSRASPQFQDPAGWRLPFTGTFTISAGPGCTGTHQGASSEAVDYAMGAGTVIKATANGIVSFFGWNNNGYGNLVTLDHSPSPVKRSYYAHLQSFSVSSVGQSISSGTMIGRADSTGNSTGNHLHFEARRLDNNTGVWVRTLATTTWRSGSANNPCFGTVNEWDGTATGP